MSGGRSVEPSDYVSENVVQAREKHYSKFLGPMEDRISVTTGDKDNSIIIYRFKPTRVRDYWTLITGGMSDRRQYVPEEMVSYGSRTEILMYVREPRDWMIKALREMARMPFARKTFIKWYHTVPNGKPVDSKKSELTDFLFLPPYFEDPDFDEMIIEGDKVNMLWMVPITENERHLAMEEGGERLEEIFMEAHLDLVVNEERKSIV